MSDLTSTLAEYDKLNGSTQDLPEAGAAHYLKRGALQGISALADVVPNLYNLGKAAVGASAIPEILSNSTGRPASEFRPDVGKVNPIGQFLLENYDPSLNEPSRPSSSIGGELGASVLEGLGSSVGLGPIGVAEGTGVGLAKKLGLDLAKNAVLGSLAGGGSYAGGEATGGSEAGKIAGAVLTGAVAPATFIKGGGLTIGAIRAGKGVVEDMKAKSGTSGTAAKIEPAFNDYVGSTVKGAVKGTPNAAENLTEGLKLQEKIPGFNPSVAEMANSPGLIDIQKKYALLNPKNLNAEVARTEANAKAIEDYYRANVPAAESPSGVRSAVNQSLADYDKTLQEQAQGVAGKLPVADQFGLGSNLTALAKSEKEAASVPIREAYASAFKAAGETPIDISPVIKKAENILGEKLSEIKPSSAPQTVRAINDLAGKNTATLEEIDGIRKAINADSQMASRSNDPLAATRLNSLTKLHSEIDSAIANSKLTPEAKSLYSNALEKYRTEFAPRFKQGSNLEVFGKTSLNEPKILPDRFISEYFKPDSQGGVTQSQQFSKLFGTNQAAKTLASEGILDLYRGKVVNPTTGTIDQTAHNAFMRDYGRTLRAYGDAGIDVGGQINHIGQEAARVSASMDKLNSLASSLKFDTVDSMANDALRNPKTMGNILGALGPDKRQTLNTILLDKAFESGTADGMSKFLEAHKNTLRMTVPEQQMTAMQDIAKALAMTERAPIRGNVASGGADMLKNATGVSAATVFSQIRAVTGGRSSAEWAAINMAMPALNKMTQTSFANVMENALHSPQSAVNLRNYLMSETPQDANKWAGALMNSIKMGGKLAWAAKGPITTRFLGPEQYLPNISRIAPTIEAPLNDKIQKDLVNSFDGGGYTGDGERTGGVDGKGGFYAVVHPQETIVDHTKIPSPDKLAAMTFLQLNQLREQNKGDPAIQAQIAPFEHQQFAKNITQEDPLNGLGLAIATPGYFAAKSPGLINISKALGIVGPEATPASLAQLIQAYQGIGQGLKNANWKNTGASIFDRFK